MSFKFFSSYILSPVNVCSQSFDNSIHCSVWLIYSSFSVLCFCCPHSNYKICKKPPQPASLHLGSLLDPYLWVTDKGNICKGTTIFKITMSSTNNGNLVLRWKKGCVQTKGWNKHPDQYLLWCSCILIGMITTEDEVKSGNHTELHKPPHKTLRL